MNFFDDLKMVYKKAASLTVSKINKNPIVLILPLVYFIIYKLAMGVFSVAIAPVLGFLSGFILPIISSLILSSYYSQLSDVIFYDRLNFKNFKSSFKEYFASIYSVYFILILISWLMPALSTVRSLYVVVSLILVIVFNPIAESIYIRGEYYTSAYRHSIEFIKENFVLWILPFALYLVILNLLGIDFENYILTSGIIDIPLGLNTQGSVNMSFDINNIKEIIIILITAVYAIFRGNLYKILHNSTRRKREYMGEIWLTIREKIEEKLQNIVFIELKKEYQLKDLSLPVGTSLPIKLEYLLDELKEEKTIDNIEALDIIDSIIYLLGIDKDFKYKKKYIEILLEMKLDLKGYVMYKAYENENKNIIDSLIYLKSYQNILVEDEDILFKEGNILEAYYNEGFEDRDEEENKKFLEEIIRKYNDVLNINDMYDLAYYRLAYVNLNLKKFIKSKLYFEKFINYTKNEELKEDARSKLEILKNYASFDAARAYISKGDFTKAKIEIDKIDDNFQKDTTFYYIKGLCEYNLGQLEEAEESINKSIETQINEENINLLAMIYLNKEEYNSAIEVYKQGVEKLENSFVLNYNLGLILLDLSEKEEAIKYLNRAYEIEPRIELKEFIKNIK